ncbi:D-galactarate dehydratase [Nioella ostreopsis]|uniref:D-galactarate dehydratase n=1 Tax=Nioella ostreopsis TaxID=2448479 RepID=UPI000FD9162E|nr:D-galactarate dehydratase [Nioella ostreopsis]
MTQIIRALLALALVASLAGCGDGFRPLSFLNRDREASAVPPPSVANETEAEEGAEETDDEPAAAAASGVLGTTVASLGDPTAPGLWLETPLVTTETAGRLEAENGNSVEVTLRPSGGEAGSGSRISLMALQALGLGLTDLPTLTVIAGG